MSVIIRDMDYPENCAVCKLAQDRVFSPTMYCPITGHTVGYYDNGLRLEKRDCPLGKLPEKYGRLIDADAVIEAYTPDSYELNKMHMTREAFDKLPTVAAIKRAISNASTIVPAEGWADNG